MAKDISNSILLEHIQALKGDIEVRLNKLDSRITRLEIRMDKGFEEARQHREALQEDLDVTMRTVYTHGKKLARSS